MSNFLHLLLASHPEACRAYFYGAVALLALPFVFFLAEGSGLVEEIFGEGLSFWMASSGLALVAVFWPIFVAYYVIKLVFIAFLSLFEGGSR